MLKLYEIVGQYQTLMSVIDSGDGVTKESFQLTLAKIEDNFNHKVENIAKFCLDIEASIEAIKIEEARLASRRASLQNKVQWFKDYLLDEMIAIGVEQVKRDTVTVSVRINPPSVALVDITALPREFLRLIPENWEADKKKILEHYKSTGELLDGVEIVTKKRVDIR